MDKNVRLTRDELARAAESAFRRTFPHLAKHGSNAITERTIRFWTHCGLLPSRGRPNHVALYEKEILSRCVFIRRLQVEEALTLQDIREVLVAVDQETIERVATGTEPLRIGFALNDMGEKRSHPDEKVVMLRKEKKKMIAANERSKERRDDHPLRLKQTSDSEKEEAVVEALKIVAHHEFSVAIRAIDYSARMFDRGPFRSPAKIGLRISSANAEAATDATRSLRESRDEDLCTAIANALSRRTNECYVLEVLRKRYELSVSEQVVDLDLLVATAE